MAGGYVTEAESEEEEQGDQWVEDEDEESDFAFLSTEDATTIEVSLDNSAFIHGRSHKSDLETALLLMNHQLSNTFGPKFEGIRLETYENRSSLIGKTQY